MRLKSREKSRLFLLFVTLWRAGFYAAARYFINRHKDVVGAGDFVVDIGVFCDIMVKSKTLKANSTVKVACRERPVGERATRTFGNTCRSRPLNKQ